MDYVVVGAGRIWKETSDKEYVEENKDFKLHWNNEEVKERKKINVNEVVNNEEEWKKKEWERRKNERKNKNEKREIIKEGEWLREKFYFWRWYECSG